MGIQLPNTAQNGPSLTTNVLDYLQPYTMCCWTYVATPGGVSASFACVGNSTSAQRDIDYFEILSSSFNLAACDSSSINELTGSTVTANKWYWLCMVRNSNTDLRLYVGDLGKYAVQDIQNTKDVSARLSTRNYMSWGNDGPDGDNGNMILAYGKAWQVALTQQEMWREQFVASPVRTASIYGFWPFVPGISTHIGVDQSGARNHMPTITGSVTPAFDPPIPWSLPDIHWIPSSATPPATLTQSAFRFRNDDGSETTATWRQTQNTNDSNTVSTRFRLRFLLNATNNPTAQNFMLQVKKSTESDAAYRKVTVKQ